MLEKTYQRGMMLIKLPIDGLGAPVGDDGKPQQLPWEDWREGEDQNTSGWMRATASAGSADFEGIVAWAGELGYGVRDAEQGQRDGTDDEQGQQRDGDDEGGGAS